MSYRYASCECGMNAHGNMDGPLDVIVQLHVEKGHVVTVWARGRKDEAVQVGESTP